MKKRFLKNSKWIEWVNDSVTAEHVQKELIDKGDRRVKRN